MPFLDFGRTTDLVSFFVWLACAVGGLFLFGNLVKFPDPVSGTDKVPPSRGLPAALLALAGGIIARLFLWMLLRPIDPQSLERGSTAVGYLFFLPLTILEQLLTSEGGRALTTPDGLLMMATIVGSFIGMMDGLWRIHDWKGLGWLTFPIDMAWGLAGHFLGMLLHLVNFSWGDHAKERGTGAHRYSSGFRLKGTFAFTQGSVMSNLSDTPGKDLYRHEASHVLHNRLFGPFYTLTYIGWMLTWVIPGAIAGLLAKKKVPPGGRSPGRVGIGAGIERLCYYNNPWETWAYKVQKVKRKDVAGGPELIWGPITVIVLGVLVCGTIATWVAREYLEAL